MKILKWAGVAVVVVLLLAGGGFAWASSEASAKMSRTFAAHSIDIPTPMSLTEAEVAELRAAREKAAGGESAGDASPEGAAAADPLAGIDLAAIAEERAVERGKHLVESRFVCIECHGKNFGGGVMVDDPALGRLLGPNLTLGKGGVVADYTMADWNRIVRHGIKKNGTPAFMPSEDFVGMSDRELSDVVTYIKTFPPVDNEVPASTLGPVGKILVATGKLSFSADRVTDHQAAHAVEPPETAVTAEFGKHVAQVCTGCHRANFEGGPITTGDPSWPIAANLTPHADGIAGWTFEQFATLMQKGTRPDGTTVKMPMSLMPEYAKNWTDTEMQAVWKYLQSLSPVPMGQ